MHDRGRDRTSSLPARVPRRFVALFIALVATMLFLVVRDESIQRAAIETEVRNELLSSASSAVRQVQEWRRERIGDARSVMADAAKLDLLAAVVAGTATPHQVSDLRVWLDSAFRALRYAQAVVTDAHGRVVQYTGAPLDNENNLRRVALRAVADGDILYQDIEARSPGQAPYAYLGIALRRDPKAPPFGVLILTIDPRAYIFPLLQPPVGSRSTFELLLARADGEHVTILNEPRNRSWSPLSLQIPIAHTGDPIVQAVVGAPGWIEGVDYRGVRVYAVVVPVTVPRLRWIAAAKVDRAEVLADHWRHMRLVAAAAFSFLVAVGAMLLGYVRSHQAQLLRAQIDRLALVSHVDLLTRYANDAILLLDHHGAITEANDRALTMYGYTAEELQRLKIDNLRSTALFPVEQRWAEIEKEGALIFETVHRRKDGSEFPAEASARLFEVEGKKYVQTIIRDVTERKRAERERAELQTQLLQAQRLETVGRLAGGVAHDFNNHLTVIRGYCDLLLRRFGADASAGHQLDQIREAARCAGDLTRRLLAFSRKQVAQARRVSVNQVVAESIDMLGRLIGDDIAIITNLYPLADPVLADPGLLKQVLMNLATNARDAMSGSGTLTIETRNMEIPGSPAGPASGRDPGSYVVLSVADTGIGMSEEIIEKIFDPFFTTKADLGTGLGLSTAYGVVRDMGGWIEVRSRLGEGATFQVYLPATAGEVEPGRPKEPLVAARSGSETILVVEDHDDIRELTVSILSEDGYRLLVAATGAEAIRIAAAHDGAIDLLLSDVVMPGMNGPELAGRLKEAHPTLKVLFVSGYLSDTAGIRNLLEQGTPYLQKPFGPAELCASVRQVLGVKEPRETVLIADDDPAVLGFLADVLSDGGYCVVQAPGAGECLAALREQPVDLVITDMVMPGMEGLELIRALRKDHPRIPVVLMSGATHQGLIRAALHLGGRRVLTKPISPDDLLCVVREILPAG
jgi:PAS domain S-box-containing protein